MRTDTPPETVDGAAAVATTLDATPVTFDGLFGWLHPAPGRRGVVLCGAHGFEQVAAHRAWRTLADGLAAAGCPTLRFDYPGEGDSGDVGEARIAAFVAAIRRAVDFLRETAGVTQIVLVGLRLGANLAALAAEEAGVDRLILLAPVTSGRAYLREMRLRALAMGDLPDGQAPGGPTVGGFPMSPALVADLTHLDAASIRHAPAPRILILAPEARLLANRLTALGCAVETGPLPGLVQLVGDPIFAEVPVADFDRITAFAAQGLPVAGPALPRRSTPARLDGGAWIEEPARFGSGLFGIRCTPGRPEPGAPTVLFVSTGMTVRSGWGRQTTDLARILAAEGIPSLRFDLAGIGDSADRPDGRRPPYAPDGFADISRALDHLAGDDGPRVLVGNCSGAYAVFHALCRDTRVDGALVVNLFCFDWDPTQDVHAVIRRTYGSVGSYVALLRHRATWRRLLSGQIHVRAIATTLSGRALRKIAWRIRRLVNPVSPGGSVARRIASLRRRGAQIRLIYGAGDPGLAALYRDLGRSPGLADRRLGAPVAILPGVDHNFSTRESHVLLANHLRDLLRTLQHVSQPALAIDPASGANFGFLDG